MALGPLTLQKEELLKYCVKGATLASAGTVTLADATGDFVDISGDVNILSLGAAPAGLNRITRFLGIPDLIYNAVSLILPGAVNIELNPNDVAIWRSLGGSNWLCIALLRADGFPLYPGWTNTGSSQRLGTGGAEYIEFYGDGGPTTTLASGADVQLIAPSGVNVDSAAGFSINSTALITAIRTGTAVLDFPSTLPTAESILTISVASAPVGSGVFLAVPAAAVLAGGHYSAWISAVGVVSVKFCNFGGIALDPPSATFGAYVVT